jgi:hypothetical protein
MGTAGLQRALQRGAPLVDIVVRFREGVDYQVATAAVNALGDDIDLHLKPWYDDPALRIGTATKEALERLFGWRLVRVPLERYDEATGAWGTWPDTYYWTELNEPQAFPESVAALIASIGSTQPGADDDGQWYE